MPGVSRGVRHAAVLTGNGVIKLHAGAKGRIEGGLDNQDVIIARWGVVFTLHLGDGQHEPPGLDFPVGQSQVTEQFGAANLKPAQVIGVIHDPHGIRVAVDHPIGGAVGQMG